MGASRDDSADDVPLLWKCSRPCRAASRSCPNRGPTRPGSCSATSISSTVLVRIRLPRFFPPAGRQLARFRRACLARGATGDGRWLAWRPSRYAHIESARPHARTATSALIARRTGTPDRTIVSDVRTQVPRPGRRNAGRLPNALAHVPGNEATQRHRSLLRRHRAPCVLRVAGVDSPRCFPARRQPPKPAPGAQCWRTA